MKIEVAVDKFDHWFRSLKVVKVNKGPANGTIANALVLLEGLKTSYNLDLASHIAKGGAQIIGASGKTVTSILSKFDEKRPFLKEGGRTNRGGLGDLRPLFLLLKELNLEDIPKNDRIEYLTAFQAYLVDRVRDFHNRQKIKLVFDAKFSTWQIIRNLLEEAKREGKAGFVAQHLVGAKLQLRFPELNVSNESASTADKPTNRQGDFFIGNTVFHVTVVPMQAVFEKCKLNIIEGYKVYLLIPDSKLVGARQMGEEFCNGQAAIESLESFVSQNIEEISFFENGELKSNLKKLVDIYNHRVDAVEIDKSLMIELPVNLKN